MAPHNRLGTVERDRLIAVMASPEFVDEAPIKIYRRLLDEGMYLASISTMYRILAEHRQVKPFEVLAHLVFGAVTSLFVFQEDVRSQRP